MPAALPSGLRGAACSGLLAGTLATISAQDRAPALVDLTARAGAYVQRVSKEYATLLGDERYEQQFVTGSPLREPRRLLVSEVLFVWLAEEQSWLTARIVKRADGKPVADSETRLERLLTDSSTSWPVRMRALRDEGARFNIGRLERNFGDPMLALQFLDPHTQPRFEFKLEGRERIGDRSAWRVSFKERTYPTLIRSNGRDVLATGDIWLAGDDQAVLRTRVSLVDRYVDLRIRATIRVTYRSESRFGIWLPAEMRETYEQDGRGVYNGRIAQFNDRVECVATYSNFRRFETGARLVN